MENWKNDKASSCGRIKIRNLILALASSFVVSVLAGCNSSQEYTVEFNGNGGTLVSGDTTQTISKAEDIVEPTFERRGYSFDGWDTPIETIVESTKINAEWKIESYRINYHLDGGINDVSNPSYFNIASGSVALKGASKVGYTFDYWSDANGKKITTISTSEAKSIDLYANYKATGYSITYNMNGGTSLTYMPTTYNIETGANIPNLTRTGYTFKGWSAFQSGTDAKLDYSISKGKYGDVKLYAVFEANKYVITFNVNGGDALISNTQEVTYDSSYSLPATSKMGYTFCGWVNGSMPVSQTGTWSIANNVTLVASWTLNKYTIQYDLNGGTNNSQNKKSYTYEDNTFVINEPTRVGYTFVGWTGSCGETPVKNVTISKGTIGNKTYTANWEANHYTITLDANGGTVSESEIDAVYDSAFSLPIPTRTGYEFKGWKDSSTGATVSGGTYTYAKNISLTANWEVILYPLSFDLNGGSSPSALPNGYTVEDEISIPDPTRAGCIFIGWTGSCGETPTKGITIQSGSTGDKTYTANWEAISYSLSFDLDDGTSPSALPAGYTVEDEISIPDPTRTGYTFVGWTGSCGETPTKGITVQSGSTGDKTYTANWEANLNVLTVTSMDDTRGTVSVTKGSGYTDEEITVEAAPIGDCVFKGWYNGSDLVSKDNPCTFTMPSEDYALSAKFFTKAEAEEEVAEATRRKALAIDPVVSADGKTLTYGLYPQTHVSDTDTIASLNELTAAESNGWYLLDGVYYAKKSANPYSSNYKFDDGTTIVSDTTYWFRCEPIEWKILSSADGTYSVVSSALLDAHRYDDSSNNYKDSEIREWLNGTFYNTAFALGNDHIETTEVDNSASTTGSSNSYACANTNDNVYLLSYKDYANTAYFADSSMRGCKTTDWADASGVIYNAYTMFGYYLTRSPSRKSSTQCWYVNSSGNISDYYDFYNWLYFVHCSHFGVRPGLSLTI